MDAGTLRAIERSKGKCDEAIVKLEGFAKTIPNTIWLRNRD